MNFQRYFSTLDRGGLFLIYKIIGKIKLFMIDCFLVAMPLLMAIGYFDILFVLIYWLRKFSMLCLGI